MQSRSLTIATRKSPLALWQAESIRQQLMHFWPHLTITLKPMVTSGDLWLDQTLSQLGGKGLFLKELETALLNNTADLAVHSMKDVPAVLPPGLCLAAICERHNPLDVLLSPNDETLDALPAHARIGTASLRRQSQLLAHRADLNIKPLRGNIQTRIQQLDDGQFDAIILAAAGLLRMNLTSRIQSYIPMDILLPAPGQGALGIECRANDDELLELIKPLNHLNTEICVSTERLVNAALGGNCRAPVAIYCTSINNMFNLRAKVLSPDGKTILYDEQQGANPVNMATRCAENLLHQGAKYWLQSP